MELHEAIPPIERDLHGHEKQIFEQYLNGTNPDVCSIHLDSSTVEAP